MYSRYLSHVLNTPRCTHDIPPMYSWYPPDVLNTPDVLNIPRCTEHTLYRVIPFMDKECEFITFTAGHEDKLFTNVRDTRSTVNLLIMRNTIPNRIDVVIYLKSIFFSEKFNTDIEVSENKKPIWNFRLGSSKAFYVRLPRILKCN